MKEKPGLSMERVHNIQEKNDTDLLMLSTTFVKLLNLKD